MVTKDMCLFWTIFNLSNLWSPIVQWLVGIAVGCSESITLAFSHAIATINPVKVATFFIETCKGIFNHLFRAKSSESGLFAPVSAYFRTIEINGWGMHNFHCLVWLKEMSSFFDLRKKIAGEDQFKSQLFLFLDKVIRFELTHVDTIQVLPQVGPLTLAANNTSVFAFHLNDNANLVASRVQMHSQTYNATCFN